MSGPGRAYEQGSFAEELFPKYAAGRGLSAFYPGGAGPFPHAGSLVLHFANMFR